MSSSRQLLFLIVVLLFAYVELNAQGETIVKDFNKDKKFDFLVLGMEWGEIEQWDYVLTDGANGKRWGYCSSTRFSGPESMISIAKTRNELGADWDPYIQRMEDSLIVFRHVADPSLQWVLSANASNIESRGSIFDRVIHYELNWNTGKPTVPANYMYRLSNEEAEKFERAEPFDTYFWIYRAHNHEKEPQPDNSTSLVVDGDGLYTTKHGLVMVKGNQFAWLFMSGVDPTGGPSKLRWTSMKSVKHWNELLVLQQGVMVDEIAIWIGDPEHGIWTRLAISNAEDPSDISLDKDRLSITDGHKEVVFTSTYEEILSHINNLEDE